MARVGIRLRYNIVRQLFDDRVISLNLVRSKVSLTDPLTKPLGRKQVCKRLRGMRLMPVTKINNDGYPTYEFEKPNK